MLICVFALFSPDGKKKAYVRLTSDHDALDVANKVCLESVRKAMDFEAYQYHVLQFLDRIHLNNSVECRLLIRT